MSVGAIGAIGTIPRGLAQVAGDGGSTADPAASGVLATAGEQPAADGGLPPTLTIGGRLFTLRMDQATGHPQYAHSSEQRDPTGNHLTLEIVIDLAPDGSYSRSQKQALALANGDSQTERSVATFSPQGVQTGDTVDSTTREAGGSTDEHTVSTFTAGKETRRETDVNRTQAQTDTKTKEVTSIKLKVHGTWDEGGQPITATTVPVVDRTEEQKYLTPGQGINKDTDRLLTFTRHGAGPATALDWDEAGKLIVRFNGHGGQYIERELKVPLNAAGEPNLAAAETVRTDDHQSGVSKGLMQARVWGGLVSNLSWFGGIMAMRGGGGGIGKALISVSAAASAAQMVGEGHALATKRNDGSIARFTMSVYDTALTGLLAGFMTGKRNVVSSTGPGIGGLSGNATFGAGLGLGAIGASNNGRELLQGDIGTGAIARNIGDAKLGAAFASPTPSGGFDRQWRLEPRIDAGHMLLR